MIVLRNGEDHFRWYLDINLPDEFNDLDALGKFTRLHQSESLISFLDESIIIEPGVKFDQLISILFNDWMKYELVFSSSLNGLSLRDWVTEYSNSQSKDWSPNTIIYFNWMPDIINVHKSNVIRPPELFPMIIASEMEEQELSDVMLYECKSLPIILDYTVDRLIKLDEEEEPMYTTDFMHITVYNFLHSLFKSMSLNGPPEIKHEETDSLNKLLNKFGIKTQGGSDEPTK